MFDLRYHVASLAAVFVALVIGILVGVAISSNSSISNPERKVLEQQKAEFKAQRDAVTARLAQLARTQSAAVALSQAAYPLVMADRLRGLRIGLVFVGPADSRLRSLVQTALQDANALPTVRFRSLKVPIDGAALAAVVRKRPALAALVDPAKTEAIGRELGRELALGADTPMWNALSAQLIAEQSGGSKQRLDGVVLVRTAPPQQGASARFLSGLYAGLGQIALLVGVEQSGQIPTALPVYRRKDISSVDDLELPVGRLALAALLAGATPGHYGLQAGDTAVLPSIEPIVPAGG
jgi:Copper transport outer membrane protein, MctB